MINELTGKLLVGPSALWPTKQKFGWAHASAPPSHTRMFVIFCEAADGKSPTEIIAAAAAEC